MIPQLRSLTLGLVLAAGLGADEIELVDGSVLTGRVQGDPGAETVTLDVSEGSIRAVLHVQRARIKAIRIGLTAEEQRLADLQGRADAAYAARDAQALWLTAEEQRRAGAGLAWRDTARRVMVLEPDHAPARSALGFRRHEGAWMLPHEIAQAQGKVWHEGRWIEAAERDRLVAEEAARVAAARAEAERLARERAYSQVLPAPAGWPLQSTQTSVLHMDSYQNYYGNPWYGRPCYGGVPFTGWGTPVTLPGHGYMAGQHCENGSNGGVGFIWRNDKAAVGGRVTW